ncbi:MAG: hypothetical protein A2054_01320 [Deltaproteobacteria bacterium GWA2_55_10]|nr:MAG: hypothetical protein A2054_01320 [Deltaproteobacteria bacterium GWA2_55_10]
MGRKFPLLTRPQVEAILTALGFLKKKAGSGSSHTQWEAYINGQRRIVTVKKLSRDTDQYSDFLMRSMIEQSGLTKEEFYLADSKLAKKLGLA